ncbi:MAG: LptF/LptG family permease [Gemmatimonadaceae bacterium]|nr:LptF/LptG family permease [Gemmatimonadaceae bacterium]
MLRFLKPLDRYVLAEWTKIFAGTALGFPLLVIVLDLTEKLDKYLNRNLTPQAIALAYLYGIPDTMFLVMPAAVLFATVFAVGSFTRHSEITAAKASGISFYRFILPMAFGALLATATGLAIGAVSPYTNARRVELLKEREFSNRSTRFNFTYAAEGGRVYTVAGADVRQRALDQVVIERKGKDASYPSYFITARSGKYDTRKRHWTLQSGVLHLLPNDSMNVSVSFDSLRDRRMTEEPRTLMASSKVPDEMTFQELGSFIRALERSGSDVGALKVGRMLKIAIPVTCVIIMLFGAPLATSTQRGGTAFGVGISLGTTVIFLMLVQLTQAIGSKGLVPPNLAAWLPGMVFGTIGIVLLARVRT